MLKALGIVPEMYQRETHFNPLQLIQTNFDGQSGWCPKRRPSKSSKGNFGSCPKLTILLFWMYLYLQIQGVKRNS